MLCVAAVHARRGWGLSIKVGRKHLEEFAAAAAARCTMQSDERERELLLLLYYSRNEEPFSGACIY